MSGFAFHPELFDHRTDALDALSARGFSIFEHFGSVDLDHASFGLEVCEIHEERDAPEILSILRRTFRDWSFYDCYYWETPMGSGWKVVISRDAEPPRDHAFM